MGGALLAQDELVLFEGYIGAQRVSRIVVTPKGLRIEKRKLDGQFEVSFLPLEAFRLSPWLTELVSAISLMGCRLANHG